VCFFVAKTPRPDCVLLGGVGCACTRNLVTPPKLLEVIPNGFDLEQAKPNPTAALSLREELGVPADAILIGIAARFHPHKDHCNFVQAAALLHKQLPEVHFLLCGLDVT